MNEKKKLDQDLESVFHMNAKMKEIEKKMTFNEPKNHLNQKIRNKNNKKCILSKKRYCQKKQKIVNFACKCGGRLHEKSKIINLTISERFFIKIEIEQGKSTFKGYLKGYNLNKPAIHLESFLSVFLPLVALVYFG